MQSGGLLVAATLKYADAVLKTLATSGSIGKPIMPMMPMGVIFVSMCLCYLYVCHHHACVLHHVCECVCVCVYTYTWMGVYVCVSSLSRHLLHFCVFIFT